MSGLGELIEALTTIAVPSAVERTPTWLGGAIVFGTMAAVIIGLLAMRVMLT